MDASIRALGIVAVILCAAGGMGARCSAGNGVSVVLNELQASNVQTVKDPQGEYEDWIELHNPTGAAIDVGGLYLTDDAGDPTRWQIPTGSPSLTRIPAGGYLVIWADGDTADAGLHANFQLSAAGEGVYLYAADGTTLLDGVEFGPLFPDISYGRVPDGTGDWRSLAFPTPGSQNVAVYEGFVAVPRFSHERGLYDGPFELSLTCETPGATIYYTLDGRDPAEDSGRGPAGTPYTGPLFIFGTTRIRVCAAKDGWRTSETTTQTYIFLSNVVTQGRFPSGFPTTWGGTSADYEMDPRVVNDPQYKDRLSESLLSLPAMSLVTTNDDMFGSQRGIYANPGRDGVQWERPASVELIYPDGRKGFQVNCGVRIQGGYFRTPSASSKKSFRLLFKGIYGATKLRYPLFGDGAADEFDTITLRAGANDGYTWSGNERYAQFTRDQFARDLQRGAGHAGSHGLFVHLYVNGLYWGLYNPCERPDASFSASYYGGDKEEWDAFKHKGFALNDGNRTALNEMTSLSQQAGGSLAAYQRLQGRNPDGSENPDYAHLLDVANYIDYMIVNLWAGNWDWPWNNYWLARRRGPDSSGFKFYCWDAEDIMLSSRSPLTINRLSDYSDVGRFHGTLRQNPEYRLTFADHVHRHFFNGGLLAPDSLVERYQDLAGSIESAVIAELARWGDQHGRRMQLSDWQSMRNQIVSSYLPRRSDIVLQQFHSAGLYPSVAAPVFYVDGLRQHGHVAATGSELSMREADGTIWYTLDGSDPRLPEGATAGESSLLVAEDAAKRVLVPLIPVDPGWRTSPSFDDSAWISGTGGVGYERSTGYEPYFDIDVGQQMYGRTTTCYIRIPFDVSQETLANLSNLALRVRYDDGFIAYLNGVEIARRNFEGNPIWTSAANAQNSDLNAVEFEPIDVSAHLSALRVGPNLLAVQAMNDLPTSSDLLFSATLGSAQVAAGGTAGRVSPRAIQYTGPLTLSRSTPVAARSVRGASWSALNEAVFGVGPVAESLRVSELMYHPADPNAEYVELTNIGSQTINLNLVAFTDGIQFTFRSVELAPGAYVLVAEDVAAFEAAYGAGLPVVGPYSGKLSNAGERIELRDATGAVIQSFTYRDDWYRITDGQGFSLTVKDPAGSDSLDAKDAWRPSARAGGSPGFDDSGVVPELGAVVLNEVLASTTAGAPDWIELHNTTDEAIEVGGWFLSDGARNPMKYEIAPGTIIGPKGYLVLREDETFGNEDDPGCHVPFALSRDGETLYLHSGADGALTGYSVQETFGASETDVTLGRHRTSTGSYDFIALRAATPGAANDEPRVGPVVISEIMYNPAERSEAEYVKLLNVSDAPVTLYDDALGVPWRFADGPDEPQIELLLPSDEPVTLAPGRHLLLVRDPISFAVRYGVVSGMPILAWGPGKLANHGRAVQISMPGGVAGDGTVTWICVDRVAYSDGSHPEDFGGRVDPWPVEADGQGLSLHRVPPTSYGNDPANWQAALPSPERAGR
ncbi:lamin tail domain-containing protein [Anaerobaca lacustris]|uniref:Lamin tail domain-containing protein n=1 Tax=Anaerobaca lacustris TaxID=3044600 RepID=A0AAW6U5G6_9BACT|nr:lamin tail domain-containing protein [Sedimentisphaerales bacterium M17dextr]